MKGKNKLFAFLAMLLSAVTLISAGACKKEETPATETAEKVTYEGTHDYTAPERSDYLVKNGRTEYKLVLPAEQGKYIKMAKREFTYLFAQATGIGIAVIEDTGLTHDSEAKYISLGRTSLLSSSGIEADKKQLGTEGHKIVTKDNTIYLVGGSDEGTLFAVYTFMEINFNYDCFANDCISIDKNIAELKNRDYNVTDIPDIPVRFQDGGSMMHLDTSFDEYYPARMRELHPYWDNSYELTVYPEFGVYENGKKDTNTETVFPRSSLYNAHSSWYSDNGRQMCYSAHGNEAEFRQMTQYAAAKVIDAFIASPASENDPPEAVVTISCEDNTEGCTCRECAKYSTQYGTDSAALIVFFNEVGRLVDEWCKGVPTGDIFGGDGDISVMLREQSGIGDIEDRTPYIREDYHIIFFAYYMYTYAPCVYENGEARPIDERMKLRDNVGVWLANIYTDFTQSVYSELNKKEMNNIKGWASVTDFVWNYSYWINFRTYNWFYDFFSYFNEDTYRLMAANNTKTYYHQSSNTMSVTTNFRQLGSYLNSKLGWNSSLKAADLTEKYFNAMYKEAAPVMKRLFLEERAHYVNMNNEYSLYTSYSCGKSVGDKKYFPLQTMYAFMNRCDEAMELIAKYKAIDNELYVSLSNHINMERISPMYWTLKHYADEISVAEKNRLISVCEEMDKTLNLSLNMEAEGASRSFRDFYTSI